MRAGVAVPIAVDGAVIGALAALGPSADAALMRTAARGRQVRVHPPGAGRARRVPHPHGAGPAELPPRADQPALHLQRAHRDRVVRPVRSGAGQGPAGRLRRVHPVDVPRAQPVRHARRGTAVRRHLPGTGAGPLRRPAGGQPAGRPRGAAGAGPVAGAPAAGGERDPARPGAVRRNRPGCRSPRRTAVTRPS